MSNTYKKQTEIDQDTSDLNKNMQNLSVDEDPFSGLEKSKKKKKGKQPKPVSTKKGEDFLEYAKKHEIDVDFTYEKSPERKKEEVAQEKKKYTNNYSSTTNSTTTNKPYNNNTNTNNYQNKNYKKNYKNNNNNNEFNKQQQTKVFNNKFDQINSYNTNPYSNPNMHMMRPEMMFMGQMPMQPINFPMQVEDNMYEKGVKESLEYYLSLEHLNKDKYIRQKIDNNGYIDVEEILKFNNMKKHKADLDTIRDCINNKNSPIEEASFNNRIYIRNKDWNQIKNYLIPIEEIESRKSKKNYNFNYVTMQNNYFMPMMPYDQNMMMQGMNYMNYMPNVMGGMHPYGHYEN